MSPGLHRRGAEAAAGRSASARRGLVLSALLCVLGAFAPSASAQPASGPAPARKVALAGSMGGSRAVLVIDGEVRTLSVGAVDRGVRLVALREGEAQVEIDGRPALLRLGAAGPLTAGARGAVGSGGVIVLSAGLGGHFTTTGSINGKPVEFLVDTGATSVAIGQADADRLGLAYRSSAKRGMAQTANGVLPVHFVTLTSVRIGDVEVYNIDAAVIPAQMSHVLLGNSFLTRFQMKRENDTLTLEKRP